MSLPGSNLGNAPAQTRGVFVEKPPANVYTVMMVLALVALLIGCAFLFAEMKIYDLDMKASGAKFIPPAPAQLTPPKTQVEQPVPEPEQPASATAPAEPSGEAAPETAPAPTQ